MGCVLAYEISFICIVWISIVVIVCGVDYAGYTYYLADCACYHCAGVCGYLD